MKRSEIIISSSNDLLRLKPERIVYVESCGNYSNLVLHDRKSHILSMNLHQCQIMFEAQLGDDSLQMFIRLGKQLIVNRSYIYTINIIKQELVMSDMTFNEVFTLKASKEALKDLKAYLEKGIKKI